MKWNIYFHVFIYLDSLRVGNSANNSASQDPVGNVSFGQGFVLSGGGTENGAYSSSNDPMVQQIQNIRAYITEAKRLNKFEEVRMLQENLKDLQVRWPPELKRLH